MILHGQRPHEHGIGDAEGRGGGADTDREGRDRDSGEARVPPQRPQPVADVLQHVLQPRRDPDVAHLGAGERQVAHRPPGREGRRIRIESASVVLDNLAAHKAPGIRALIEAAGATIKFLSPYSYDFNPIEPGWALVKKRIRAVVPRTAGLLRCTAQRARRVIRPRHCRSWFSHAGYQVN